MATRRRPPCTDGDGDYSDETTLLDTTAVDDAWSGGYAGLWRGPAATGAAQFFDDLKLAYDANTDGDILDAGGGARKDSGTSVFTASAATPCRSRTTTPSTSLRSVKGRPAA